MMGKVEQRIIRHICQQSHGEKSQTYIAKVCGCPVSYVNKVVSRLCRKNFLHKPMKNAVTILDFSGLLLYWAFRRDLKDEKIKEIRIESVEKFEANLLAGSKTNPNAFAPALFWAAKRAGTSEATYNTTYFYTTEQFASRLVDEQNAKEKAVAIIVDTPKEFIDDNQLFADLVSLNTWDSKYIAFKLAAESKPIFGVRKEIRELI